MIADLPFVLQGLNAPSVEWNSDFSLSVRPDLPPAAASLMHLLLEPGLLFRRIKAIKTPEGLLFQALWECVDAQFEEYRVILGGLERRLNQGDASDPLAASSSGTHTQGPPRDHLQGDSPRRQSASAAPSPSLVSLYDVLYDATRGLRALYAILRQVELNSRQLVLRSLYPFTRHGDPYVAELASQLYKACYAPFNVLLQEWTAHGTLNDPFNEFFVQIKDPESLWSARFRIDSERLPAEISSADAQKLYEQGRDIYFLRQLCPDVPPSCTNVMQILDHFKLRPTLQALYDYLLLTRGDFGHALVAEGMRTLDVPCSTLHRHALVQLLETAIVGTSSAQDDPQILAPLDARTLGLEGQGWQVFTLDYKLATPLDVIVDRRATRKYLSLFRYFWSLRWGAAKIRHCYVATNSRSSPFARAVAPAAVQCWRQQADLCLELTQFFDQLQSYVYAEVLDRAWRTLGAELDRCRSVDAVTAAHQKFLDTVLRKAMFGGAAGGAVRQLGEVVRLVVEFAQIVDRTVALLEQAEPAGLDAHGLEEMAQQLEQLQTQLLEHVLEFLQELQALDDLDAKSFIARLNFNQHYFEDD